MNLENIISEGDKPRILVVPLDWGLGHATRCIPMINALQDMGAEVIVAGEGPIVKIIEKALPKIVILRLKGYRVRYSRQKKFFLLKMLQQSFKIFSAIRFEHKWLRKAIQRYRIDAVISDNRFGLSSKTIPCVFMTHQLFIATGNKYLDRLAQRINYAYINKFSACWVPDVAGENNLAGKLSHPQKFPKIPVSYIGPVSRFSKAMSIPVKGLLVLLSGPEPQRTIFENLIKEQIKNYDGPVTILRGLPGSTKPLILENNHVKVYDHLATEELAALIVASEHIVARCGYSTIMDLVAIGRKAILVPTPGQTEQEYLAKHLMERKLFYTCLQEDLDLTKDLALSEKFNFVSPEPLVEPDLSVIRKWLQNIPAH